MDKFVMCPYSYTRGCCSRHVGWRKKFKEFKMVVKETMEEEEKENENDLEQKQTVCLSEQENDCGNRYVHVLMSWRKTIEVHL
jgi:hypothetical protein